MAEGGDALRVGVDATAWANPRGDGRFVRNAVTRLVELQPEVEWTLFADESAGDAELPAGAAVRRVAQRRPPTEALAAGSARGPADVLRLVRAVRGERLDAFLSPSVYSYFPVFGIPAAVGLFDANSLTHPRLVLPSRRDRVRWRLKQGLAVRRATRLFTLSEHSRAEIARHLHLDPGGIAVVGAAADPAFDRPADAGVEATLRDLGLTRDEGCLVFASGVSPHKGLDTLLRAYAAVRAQHPAPPLVITGSLGGPYASVGDLIAARSADLGLDERSLRLPGFIEDRRLAALYAGATAAVVPSLAEGFGLAAVEAAACGAPVIASGIGPHREALGEGALYFEPGDVNSLAQRLRLVIDSPREREELGRRGRAAARRLSWDETARRLGALLLDAAGR